MTSHPLLSSHHRGKNLKAMLGYVSSEVILLGHPHATKWTRGARESGSVFLALRRRALLFWAIFVQTVAEGGSLAIAPVQRPPLATKGLKWPSTLVIDSPMGVTANQGGPAWTPHCRRDLRTQRAHVGIEVCTWASKRLPY